MCIVKTSFVTGQIRRDKMDGGPGSGRKKGSGGSPQEATSADKRQLFKEKRQKESLLKKMESRSYEQQSPANLRAMGISSKEEYEEKKETLEGDIMGLESFIDDL
jgi:hypothetical protein